MLSMSPAEFDWTRATAADLPDVPRMRDFSVKSYAFEGRGLVSVDAALPKTWPMLRDCPPAVFQTWRRRVLKEFRRHLPDLVRKAGTESEVDVLTLRWNCYGGCTMCPCSPGFTAPFWSGHRIRAVLVPEALSDPEATLFRALTVGTYDDRLATVRDALR